MSAIVPVVAWGCSSSSSPATADGGDNDAGSSDAGAGADAACTKTTNLATYDAGCQWSCISSTCSAQLNQCANDCPCNNAVIASLQCNADGGDSITCFAGAYTLNSTSMALLACSNSANNSCAAMCGDGGATD